MTDQERQERDPTALQRALLDIEQEIADKTPVMIEAKLNATKVDFEIRLLKERKSALQSVLKSISQF